MTKIKKCQVIDEFCHAKVGTKGAFLGISALKSRSLSLADFSIGAIRTFSKIETDIFFMAIFHGTLSVQFLIF